MTWSWRIGKIAGINVYIHWTFLLLLAFIGFLYFRQQATIEAALLGVGFIIAVFACVLLHEFGHALMAKRFGVPTRDITLLPIGGLARMQRIPENPKQELLVAVAGPAVNVVIAAVLAGVLAVLGELRTAQMTGLLDIGPGNFLSNLMFLNVLLVVFNMLPAFPMDGGRVLRALLAMVLDYSTATSIAATAGQFMAILFGLMGLMVGNPLLIFIALFVFLGAGAESQQAQVRALLSNVAVEDAMLTRFRFLQPEDTLGRAIDELLAGSQHDFPVLEGDRYVGMLARKDMLEHLTNRGRDTPVSELLSDNCTIADRRDPLADVIQEMQEKGCSTSAVFAGDRFVGLLTLENVGELMMVRSALSSRGAGPTAPPRIREPDMSATG